MIKGALSVYSFSYPRIIIYMLQSTEYAVLPYLSWFWRTTNFTNVARRRSLVMTKAASLLLFVLRLGMILQILIGLAIMTLGISDQNLMTIQISLLVLVSYPIVWAHLITIPLIAAKVLIVIPRERKLIKKAHSVFNSHPGTTIAVAGSYGKTTVKELLATILSEGLKVAATPANKNVASSHAKFASKLTGKEDVLIIEYGEGKPGDVKRFAQTTKPDIGIITGLAPAHLDQYKTLAGAAKDILSLADYLKDKNVYINDESAPLEPYIKPEFKKYSSSSVGGWTISKIKVEVDGLSFVMKKAKTSMKISSKLVGRHLVGPLAMSAAVAHDLGLSKKQIEAGAAKTAPYEHRMQPRLLAGGWIIDDTYNGNLEGVRAGLALLKELNAKRKIYVTPGLVDQGSVSSEVHKTLGELIADCNPDKVVLMRNSVTDWILSGLKAKEYSGDIVIEDDPLSFYTNLDQIIAVGDVVLMQNDWTDNYN